MEIAAHLKMTKKQRETRGNRILIFPSEAYINDPNSSHRHSKFDDLLLVALAGYQPINI